MALEENILSAEDLALVDPFAEPSQESVLAFPEIQHKADGTHVMDHADEGTRHAIGHLQEQIFDPVIPEEPEPASYAQPLEIGDGDDSLWVKRLERMKARREPDDLTLAGDSHDFITEEENEVIVEEVIELPQHTDYDFGDRSVLDELENIQQQLTAIGGVSRQEIITLESLLESPGYFGNPRAFSASHSKTGYVTAMESLGAKIKTMVKDLIKWIMEQCRRLMGVISKALGTDAMRQHMTVSLIAKRRELLEKARRVDAVYGLKSFKSMTSASQIPPYKEATSTENFCIRYLDYRIKTTFQNRFTVGWRMIVENSGLSGHVQKLRGELDRSLKQVENYVSILQKTDPSAWKSINDNFDVSGLKALAGYWNVRTTGSPNDTIAEYRTAVHFAFRQEDTRAKRPGEFVKIANYTNPFKDNPTFGKTMGTGVDSILRSLKDLEGKISKLENDKDYNIQTGKLNEVNRRLTIVQNLFTIYLAFANYYESFYMALVKPIIVLNRQLDVFSARSAIGGIFSKESFDAEGMTLEEFNAHPNYGLRTVLGCFHKNLWVDRSEITDEAALNLLLEKGLIYQPKVIDLESDTPDFGLTQAGKALANQVFGDISEEKIMGGLRALSDPNRSEERELMREVFASGKHCFHGSSVNFRGVIKYLQDHGLVKYTPPYHPVHDADDPDWTFTDLGVEVAKLI